MPVFKLLSLDEARMKTASGRRAQVLREYLGYIQSIGRDEAGHLEVEAGESIAAVRRRLGAAARLAGMDLKMKRAGEEIYFWVGKARRGRRRRWSV